MDIKRYEIPVACHALLLIGDKTNKGQDLRAVLVTVIQKGDLQSYVVISLWNSSVCKGLRVVGLGFAKKTCVYFLQF